MVPSELYHVPLTSVAWLHIPTQLPTSGSSPQISMEPVPVVSTKTLSVKVRLSSLAVSWLAWLVACSCPLVVGAAVAQ